MQQWPWKRIWPALAWVAVLFALSSIPGDELPYVQAPLGFDKVLHIVAYAVLGMLAMRGWFEAGVAPWIIFAFCVGYGVTDELHQIFVPGRFPDVYDWIADVIGSGVGTWGMFHWLRRRRRAA
ncbi:VanZ family protein [bacterium]|nr:VanZ family protein [bacterium]